MITPIFTGTDTKGKMEISNRNDFLAYISTLEGKTIQVVVKEQKNTRSVRQNAYYHAVCVKMLADETGYTPDEMHDILRGKFLSKTIIFAGEEVVIVKSTKSLNTKEFEEYTAAIRQTASLPEWLGKKIYIPDPNEVEY